MLVFHYSANIDRSVRTTMQAIIEWESKTCLRFVKRTTEKEYLWFHRGNGYELICAIPFKINHLRFLLIYLSRDRTYVSYDVISRN